MKFFNRAEKINWYTKNYFFVGTIFLIALTFVCFYTVNDKMYMSAKSFKFMQLIYSTFGHLDFGHIMGNMITLVFVGLFFERNYGTFAMLISYLIMSILCNFAVIQMHNPYTNIRGASCAINGFYGFFFVNLIFDFKNIIKNRIDIAVNVLCFICFFIAMFIALPGLTESFEIARVVHWPGFVVGTLIGFFFFIAKIFILPYTHDQIRR